MTENETELGRILRLMYEEEVRLAINAQRFEDKLKAMPPSDGRKKDTIRINCLATENRS